jgi:hypothetical protein
LIEIISAKTLNDYRVILRKTRAKISRQLYFESNGVNEVIYRK